MSPFIPILCPVCSHKLDLSNAMGQAGEYLLVCRGREGCSFISYDLDWNFKDLSFYQGKQLIGVTDAKLTISETCSIPYDKLNLLNAQSLQEFIKYLIIFG